MSDHSYSDVSASYGRDHGLGFKTHYVSRSSGGSSDYYRMASLPSPMRSQPDKQLIAKKSPSTSSEVLQSILLLKNDSFLQTIKLRSNSIANFAAKLNCEVFSKEERMKSNVAGTRGKEKLNSNKIAAIRDATFSIYPTDVRQQHVVWKECIKAIDEMNRRLFRKSD